jgi:hypothetical protein
MYDEFAVFVSSCIKNVSIHIAHRENTGNRVSNASDKKGGWQVGWISQNHEYYTVEGDCLSE